MKRIAAAAFTLFLISPLQAAELPLKRVVLSTAGLAQFTHSGEVTPGTVIELPVRLDQVDDLLKSLTIFDREGAIGGVSLPGKAPLAELFRDLPFPPDALNSPQALLNALVGAEIEIEGPVEAKGRVFRVEEERRALPDNAGTVVRHRISLMTEKGLVQAVLEDLTALRFADPEVKAQIERALSGLARNRAKDRRTLSIMLSGKDKRTAGFSYVAAAPVWKAAYRLVLPQEDGKARLQGWGIIENRTGSDWKDVDLSLISGNPVALKQQLYTAFYSDRPEIPVAVAARVVPERDETLDARLKRALGRGASRRLEMKAFPRKRVEDRLGAGEFMAEEAAPAAEPEELAGASVAAEAEEAATQVQFRFPAKVSLANGSTMMAPFVDGEITAARTWLYQPKTSAGHPLAAVRLKNDGASALPGGLITAFDKGKDGVVNFVGDAQLPLMPKDSSKFITFALDSKTDIRRTDNGVRRSRLGKAVNGVLTLTIKSRHDIDYEITPPADEDREIVIDEARDHGWTLAPGMKDVEETAARLRYTVKAPRGETTKASLRLERLDHDTVSLATLEPAEMLTTLRGLENETPALKEAVAKLAALVAAINKAEARRNELDEERKTIASDQKRLRENLRAVGKGTDLGRRYLEMLKAQEDRIDAIAAEDKALEKEQTARRKAAEDAARSLSL